MGISSKKETEPLPRRFTLNPFSRIEELFKKRSKKKRERELRMLVAIYSGGIKRMK